MLAVTGMVLLQVWLSMQITQTGLILDELSMEYTQLEQENAELLWQISQFTHLERIETEAKRMGYGPGLNPEYRWVESSQGAPTMAVQAADGLSAVAGSSGAGQTAAANETGWETPSMNGLAVRGSVYRHGGNPTMYRSGQCGSGGTERSCSNHRIL